jgi:N-acetylglucosamine-6-sulfatase
LTGRYSHTTGVYDNDILGYPAFDEADTVATRLQAVGYSTSMISAKYLNGYEDLHVPPGWEDWHVIKEPLDEQNLYFYNYILNDNGVGTFHGTLSEDYSTDVLASKADQFIRNVPQTQPFFLFFGVGAPHRPALPAPRHVGALASHTFTAPPSFNERNVSDKPAWVRGLRRPTWDQVSVRRYHESLIAVDEAVGTVVTALEQTGRLSNTLIVFTSDNGFMFGEHRWPSKLAAYEESIRVPMVVRADFLGLSARTEARQALNIDLAPTFLSLASTSAPADGQPLLSVLQNQSVPWRTDFLIEHVTNPTNNWVPAAIPAYCAVRGQRFVYVNYLGTGEEELYDLSRDPYQMKSVHAAATYAAVLTQARLRRQQLCEPSPPLARPTSGEAVD